MLPGFDPAWRGFAELALGWRASGRLDLDARSRTVVGADADAVYADLGARWYDAERGLRLDASPHLVLSSLVDQAGLRAGVHTPVGRLSLSADASLDRVWSGGASAWAGLGRFGASRPLGDHWRVAGSLDLAVGDGPPRALVFALVGYRFGD